MDASSIPSRTHRSLSNGLRVLALVSSAALSAGLVAGLVTRRTTKAPAAAPQYDMMCQDDKGRIGRCGAVEGTIYPYFRDPNVLDAIATINARHYTIVQVCQTNPGTGMFYSFLIRY